MQQWEQLPQQSGRSMKTLLILSMLASLMLTGCNRPSHMVIDSKSDRTLTVYQAAIVDNTLGKYLYFVNGGGGTFMLYTNQQFNIGDQLQISKVEAK